MSQSNAAQIDLLLSLLGGTVVSIIAPAPSIELLYHYLVKKAQAAGDIINIASTSGMKGAAGATAYAGSKWAVRGISQCWQAELRPHGIRVVSLCPSEVHTDFGGRTGRNNPNKLYAADIAATIMAALDMPPRTLWPELAVFANNPWKED